MIEKQRFNIKLAYHIPTNGIHIPITTEIIASLDPCRDRFDNWIKHYEKFDGGLLEFLDLTNISVDDKIWVAVRTLPRFEIEVFANKCAFEAQASAADAEDAAKAAAYAAYAAVHAGYAANNAGAYAIDAAAAATAYAAAREKQLDILKYLTQGCEK